MSTDAQSILALRSRVEQLRNRTLNLSKKDSVLKNYLDKMKEINGTMSRRAQERKEKLQSPRDTPSLNYSNLSPEDQETMQDILTIQQWLLSVKKNRNFGKFRQVVQYMKEIIFTPPQTLMKKFRGLGNTHGRHMSSDHTVRESDNFMDEASQAQMLERFESQAQPMSSMFGTAEAPHPADVAFVDGQWVHVNQNGEVVDEPEEDDPFKDIEDIEEEDVNTSKYSSQNGCPSPAVSSSSDISMKSFSPSKSPSNSTIPPPSGPISSMDASKRVLNEFEVSDELKRSFFEAENYHKLLYGGCFDHSSPALDFLRSTDSVANALQLEWMIQQSELLNVLIQENLNTDL